MYRFLLYLPSHLWYAISLFCSLADPCAKLELIFHPNCVISDCSSLALQRPAIPLLSTHSFMFYQFFGVCGYNKNIIESFFLAKRHEDKLKQANVITNNFCILFIIFPFLLARLLIPTVTSTRTPEFCLEYLKLLLNATVVCGNFPVMELLPTDIGLKPFLETVSSIFNLSLACYRCK